MGWPVGTNKQTFGLVLMEGKIWLVAAPNYSAPKRNFTAQVSMLLEKLFRTFVLLNLDELASPSQFKKQQCSTDHLKCQ